MSAQRDDPRHAHGHADPAVAPDATTDDALGGAAHDYAPGPIPGVAPEVAPGAATATASASELAYGAPIPGAIRGELETALGADLSAVRIHGGAQSSRTAHAIGAPAYARGNAIHFAGGMPDLTSVHGRHMLAHEVAHAVQQRGATIAPGNDRVAGKGDPAEREAHHFADAFVAGAPTAGIVTAGMQPDAAIHRYDYDEHHDIPTRYLTDLRGFLATPDGEKWARDHGYDPKTLLAQMKSDPAANGKKLHGTKGAEFDFGDPTAMYGDLYDNTDEMRGMSQDKHDALGKASSNADYNRLTDGKYLALAKKNDTHYAGRNLDAWKEYHSRALEIAATKNRCEEALFVEASGAHFMTDAFSAGHQFVKADLLAAILIDLKRHPLFAANRQLQSYVAMVGTDNVAQLILKLIHDRMNEEGFEVTNDKGMTWRTFGDGYLKRSVETQRIAALAVFESRQQVLEAHTTGTAPRIDDVAAFFPNVATQQAALSHALGYVAHAREQVEALIVKERKAAPDELGDRAASVNKHLRPLGRGAGHAVESNLDAIGDPGRERNYHLNEDLDTAHGKRKDSDPTFTVKRF